MKKAFILICICLISLVSTNPSAMDLGDKEYIIGSGDILEIQVWGNEDLNRTVEVSQEGLFTFPFIGTVHAADLSVFKLEKLVTAQLADGYLVAPQVTVTVKEYHNQKAYLLGEVKKPGSYMLKQSIMLHELISEAGGFTDDAGVTATIVRTRSSMQTGAPVSIEKAQKNELIIVDLDTIGTDNKNSRFTVLPGDSIYINKAARIFVTGEVEKPGKFKWEKGLTVRQAISLAGGPTKRAAPNRTRIIRIENKTEKVIKPYMSDTVIPDDIVKVPESYF